MTDYFKNKTTFINIFIIQYISIHFFLYTPTQTEAIFTNRTTTFFYNTTKQLITSNLSTFYKPPTYEHILHIYIATHIFNTHTHTHSALYTRIHLYTYTHLIASILLISNTCLTILFLYTSILSFLTYIN